ncbi:hypothetical protein MMC34_005489 [Xylographa carneopallida]|nr:hypothetical protein [Xylographa carneopallida]
MQTESVALRSNELSGSFKVFQQEVEELAIEDAVGGIDMVWGTYTPANGTSSGADSSGGSGTTASGYGSSSSGNGTSSGNRTTTGTDGTCGAPPSATIDGFPAAACGAANFDELLDNAIGYLDFSSADLSATLQNFAPGLTDDDPSDYEDEPSSKIRRRMLVQNHRLHRRGWFSSIIKKVANTVTSAAQNIAHTVVQVATTVAKVVVDVVKTPFTPSVSTDLAINLTPKNLVPSPWGDAYQLFHKAGASSSGAASGDVTLYCVNCGVTGTVHLGGSASLNIVDGLTAAQIGMNGNIAAGLELGLDANAQYTNKLTSTIASAGLPGFSVPNIISIGPVVDLSAELDLNIAAQGQLLVGVTMSIPDFAANLDLVGSNSYSRGFTPQFTKVFNASGEISATASLGLPLSIGVGVEAPIIKFKKVVALIDTPSIGASAKFTGGTGPAPDGATCYNGLDYSVTIGNDIALDLFGVKKIDLFQYTAPPLAQGCYTLPISSSSSSGSGTTGSRDGSSTSSGSGTSGSGDGSSTSSGSDTSGSTDGSSTSSGSGDTSSSSSGGTSSSSSGGDTSSGGSGGTTSNSPGGDTSSASSGGDTSSGSSGGDTSSSSSGGDTSSSTSGGSTSGGSGGDTSSSSSGGDTTSTSSGGDSSSSSPGDTTSGGSTDGSTSKRELPTLVLRQDDTTSTNTSTNTTSDDPFLDGDDNSSANSTSFDDLESEAFTDTGNQTESDDGGFQFGTIVDTTNTYILSSDDSGNIYLDSAAAEPSGDSTFALDAGLVVGDESDRFLHYYPDVMAAFNVSRIRLSTQDAVPVTSDIITLAPLDGDSENSAVSVYIAVDSKGNYFYPVTCNIEGQPSKVFIVADPVKGLETLLLEELRYIVTGGVVQECFYIPFMAGSGDGSEVDS